MRPTFVYCPTTGPRWLEGAGPRADARVPVVVWANQSAHVIGKHLQLSAVTPRAYWRQEAKVAFGRLAQFNGGGGGDENGVIHAVLPDLLEGTPSMAKWLLGERHLALGKGSPLHSEDELLILACSWGEHPPCLNALVGGDGNVPKWSWAPSPPGVLFSRAGKDVPVSSPWAVSAVYGASAHPLADEFDRIQEGRGTPLGRIEQILC